MYRLFARAIIYTKMDIEWMMVYYIPSFYVINVFVLIIHVLIISF